MARLPDVKREDIAPDMQYAYDEIAEIMDLPLGTVKTYLHRARAELKKRLAHLGV